MNTVGARIRAERRRRGWTLTQLSQALSSTGLRRGSSVTHLSQVESGKHPPSRDLVAALDLVLKTAPALVNSFESSGMAHPAPSIAQADASGTMLVDESYRDALIRLLSSAASAIILDTPTRDLAQVIEAAIKARRSTGQARFWGSLRVILLHDSLLPWLHDEMTADFPSREDASSAREQRSATARRSMMSLLLRVGTPTGWRVYSYRFLPPFLAGALLTMPDGRRQVLIAFDRPAREKKGSQYASFTDGPDGYFQSIFDAVVEASNEEHEAVLVGDVSGGAFVCRGARWRRAVMRRGEHADDWAAAVLVITWRAADDGAHPILQINTPTTSTRELNKLSHLSGYISLQDGGESAAGMTERNFILSDAAAQAAAERELRDEFRLACAETLNLLKRVQFHYADKESLFFYVYGASIPNDFSLPSGALILPWSLDELLNIRRYQVYSNVLRVAEDTALTDEQRSLANRGLQLNLRLHGDEALREEVDNALRLSSSSLAVVQLQRLARERLEHSTPERSVAGRRYPVTGLAGLQYRAFFDSLLPAYAAAGVAGAADLERRLRDDPNLSSAAQSLTAFYAHGHLQGKLGIEI